MGLKINEMKNLTQTSKFLSLILRHRPEKIGLTLDANGWTEVSELIEKLGQHGHPLDFQELKLIVDTSDKQRFAFSEDFKKIRANQGHSVKVELGLSPVAPPQLLFHGTATKNIVSIKTSGLHRGKRHHVHLSPDENTAVQVGGRHGKAVVLKIHAGEMQRAGFTFFKSENGVWLTEEVPVQFIEFS